MLTRRFLLAAAAAGALLSGRTCRLGSIHQAAGDAGAISTQQESVAMTHRQIIHAEGAGRHDLLRGAGRRPDAADHPRRPAGCRRLRRSVATARRPLHGRRLRPARQLPQHLRRRARGTATSMCRPTTPRH